LIVLLQIPVFRQTLSLVTYGTLDLLGRIFGVY